VKKKEERGNKKPPPPPPTTTTTRPRFPPKKIKLAVKWSSLKEASTNIKSSKSAIAFSKGAQEKMHQLGEVFLSYPKRLLFLRRQFLSLLLRQEILSMPGRLPGAHAV